MSSHKLIKCDRCVSKMLRGEAFYLRILSSTQLVCYKCAQNTVKTYKDAIISMELNLKEVTDE